MVPASSGGSLKITVRDAQGGQSDWHWDGKNDRGLEVDSGVYSVRVTSEREGGGKVVFARQVQLLKGQVRRSLEGAHASPNPWASGKGALQIHFEPQDAWLSASLYSLAGERVAQAGGHGASGSLTLSAPGLAGGIYLLRLQRGPGGIANTFIAATGHNVGKSLYEPDLIPEARRLIRLAHQKGGNIPIPKDVLVADAFDAEAPATVRRLDEVQDDELILDIGPLTAADYADIIWGAGTVIWNGPVGVFEFANFRHGTQAVAQAIADSNCFSIAGGGALLRLLALPRALAVPAAWS
jgi:hypothetical protein